MLRTAGIRMVTSVAVVVAVVAFVVLASGSGATFTLGPDAASPPPAVHSPSEVDAAFASVGLDVMPTAWTMARGPEVVSRLRSDSRLGPVPGSLDLEVTVWWSIAAAGRSAKVDEQITAVEPSSHWLQAGNVTATFTVTDATAAQAALVAKAMDALAVMPAVAPPSSGVLPLASVRGNTGVTLRGTAQVHLPAYDWWCQAARYISSDGPGGSEVNCAPSDADGVYVTFGFPTEPQTSEGRQPLLVDSSRRIRRVGSTESGLDVYVFPFGPRSKSVNASRTRSARSIGLRAGLRLLGTGWLCAARVAPASLSCYRVLDGSAVSPILRLLPGRRVLEVDAAVDPDLYSTTVSGGHRSYGYSFST